MKDFEKSIEFALFNFESGDLSGIVELEQLLEINKLTHKLLSKHLELDPFENMLSEVNSIIGGSAGLENATRIEYHIIDKLLSDFIPYYNYNSITQRFVRTEEQENFQG